MNTKITKIGNSKGVIIPHEIIKALALEESDPVKLDYHEATQSLVVTFPHTKQLKLNVHLHDT